ncbi:MAG TPA: S41 family peptidase [Thermoanaerobaculia bacterium]
MKRLSLAASLLVAASLLAATEPWAAWKSPAWKTGYRETLTDDEKVAGLARVWSEMKFNFANFDLVPNLDWDAEFMATIPKVRAAKTTAEYYHVLGGLVAKLHDGHTFVTPPRELFPETYARPPLRTRLVEDKVLVVRVDDPSLGIEIGDELLSIDGVAVKTFAETEVRPYIFASTPQDSDSRTYERYLLAGSQSVPLHLKFRDARGAMKEKTVKRIYNPNPPQPPLTSFKLLDGNIGYLALNGFYDEKLLAEYEALWPQIAKTSALILDVRENGGGDSTNGWYVLSTLTDKPLRTSRWKTRKYLPSHRAWGRPESWDEHEGEPFPPNGKMHYTKPVAVLISERTFSAAEDFAVAYDAMDRGLLIGGPTGGSTGQPMNFDLPGGGNGGVCTKRDSYPDGREFVGIGVTPDIVVTPTVADVRARRDAVLERAVAALRSGR